MRHLRVLTVSLALVTLAAAAIAGGCASTDVGAGEYEEYTPGATDKAAASDVKMSAAETAKRDKARADAALQGGWSAGKRDGKRVLAGLTAPQDGRWVAPGEEPGLASGQALCKQFDGAHVCSAAEVIKADANGDFEGAPVGQTIWVSRLHEVNVGGVTYAASQEGSCHEFTYDTADRAWGSYGIPQPFPKEPLAMSLGRARPEYDEQCRLDVTKCVAHVPTGMSCNEKRAIPCCY
jgi:hypothetical protein